MIGEKAAEMIAAEHGVALNNFVGARGTKCTTCDPSVVSPVVTTAVP